MEQLLGRWRWHVEMLLGAAYGHIVVDLASKFLQTTTTSHYQLQRAADINANIEGKACNQQWDPRIARSHIGCAIY